MVRKVWGSGLTFKIEELGGAELFSGFLTRQRTGFLSLVLPRKDYSEGEQTQTSITGEEQASHKGGEARLKKKLFPAKKIDSST